MYENLFILLECFHDDEQWEQWEADAKQKEVTMDYYISEFILPVDN